MTPLRLTPSYGRAHDQVAGIAREVIICYLTCRSLSGLDHLHAVMKMIGSRIAAEFTGGHRALDRCVKILPSRIAQHLAQLAR